MEKSGFIELNYNHLDSHYVDLFSNIYTYRKEYKLTQTQCFGVAQEVNIMRVQVFNT